MIESQFLKDLRSNMDKLESKLSDELEDKRYFKGHRSRFIHTCSRISSLCPPGSKVLDLGSYLLHTSILLSDCGFEVSGLDISCFADSSLVVNRAKEFGILNSSCDDFSRGDFLKGFEGQFDCILFTEALEHITFNPILFWARVRELLAPGRGIVYLTTPNSLTIPNAISGLKNLLLLRSIGISVKSIFKTDTYGHHWKEYSRTELLEYCSKINAYQVRIKRFNYDMPCGWEQAFKSSIRQRIWLGAKSVGRSVPYFSEQLECVFSFK